MKTYIIEGIVTALSSITHNGGERNGTVTQFRREKMIGLNGKVVNVPIISGNSIRGQLRDIGAQQVLTKDNGEKIQLDAASFNLMFSGGTLESTGDALLDLEKVRQIRQDIPILSLLGGSVGSVMLPGKVDIGKLLPITRETSHLIPEKYWQGEELRSCYEITQVEMNTRKDDAKNEILREYMTDAAKSGDKIKTQMMYEVESIVAGTKFYWKVCLRDTTDVETGAFLSILNEWSKRASQVGGNGRVGHGAIRLEVKETNVIDSDIDFQNNDFVQFIDAYTQQRKDLSEYFEDSPAEKIFK